MKDGTVLNRELFDFLEPDRPRNRWPELMTEGLFQDVGGRPASWKIWPRRPGSGQCREI